MNGNPALEPSDGAEPTGRNPRLPPKGTNADCFLKLKLLINSWFLRESLCFLFGESSGSSGTRLTCPSSRPAAPTPPGAAPLRGPAAVRRLLGHGRGAGRSGPRTAQTEVLWPCPGCWPLPQPGRLPASRTGLVALLWGRGTALPATSPRQPVPPAARGPNGPRTWAPLVHGGHGAEKNHLKFQFAD